MNTLATDPSLAKPDWKKPAHWVAFGFGSGVILPAAPGTIGSVAAIPLYLLLQFLSPLAYLLVSFGLFVFGVWVCERVSSELGVHDHPGIVWDEWVGLLITLWMAPAGWGWLLAGFILFRHFDILKPWPIGWLDRKVEGGLGIMLDDLVAGLYSLVIIQLVAHWVP